MRNRSVACILATEQLQIKDTAVQGKMKVQVFRTNVADPERAKWLMDQIQRSLTSCKVNFDLDDCDRILRVVCEENIQSDVLIDLLKDAGCIAEVLPDIIQTR